MTSSFLCASDWYVQPYSSPNNYGSADGKTYESAWNGLGSVVWGKEGVAAGDTLWICGLHDSNYELRDTMLTVMASGEPGKPITIRGDCSSKPAGYADGVIWHVRARYPKGYVWNGPDEYGVYSTTQYGQSNEIPAIEDQVKVLKNAGRAPDASWQFGSYYHAPPVLYYKPTSGRADDHLLYSSVFTFSFTIFNQEYIDIKNLTWKMGGAAAVAIAGAKHVNLDNLKIQFARFGVQVPNNGGSYKASHNCSLTNSRIHDTGDGIYFTTDAGVTDVSTHWTISGNEIFNINRADIKSNDRHAIGIQGARHFTISNNNIHDIGGADESDKAAIDLYCRTPNMHVDNNVVTRNHIYNALHGGIVLESNNACDPEKMKNNVISYNVVRDGGPSGYGIAWKSFRAKDGSPSARIYNNTVSRCSDSFIAFEYAAPGDVYLTAYDFKNNISFFPLRRHFHYYAYAAGRNSGNRTAITQDNNLYYPEGKFTWSSGRHEIDYSRFRADSGNEAHSLVSDPLFVSSSDFHLRQNSPAIDAGADIGLNIDYDGCPVPYGRAPDIGAYEFVAGDESAGSVK